MKIAVIGADGMLGSEFVELCKKRRLDSKFYTIKDIDITNKETLSIIQDQRPQVIINCAAYTAVDNAEEDINTAYAVNSEGVKNLAEIALRIGSKLVHFSTDYVFSGKGENGRPYIEEDTPNPISVYGKSKLEGENNIIKTLPLDRYFILRTAWLYGKGGNNFVKTMLRLSVERDEISVVNDQFGCPTYAKDLAAWTLDLLAKGKNGVFHAVNSGYCNWYQFAKKIFELSRVTVKCREVTGKEFVVKAARPSFGVLNNNKLQQALNYSIREWSEALSEYLFLTKL